MEEARRVFEDLGDWQVHAVRAGIIRSTAFFPQTQPADAVAVLAACMRRKFGVEGWEGWAFHCIARGVDGRPLRTLVYTLDGAGRLVLLVDSRDAGNRQPFSS
jgi:hypothetical protein